jgi:hypothetical protein
LIVFEFKKYSAMSFLTIVDFSSSGAIIRFEDSSPEVFPKLTGLTSNTVLPFLPTVTWSPWFKPWS